MSLILDPQRTLLVGQKLYHTFHNEGILGEISMPEYILPIGVTRGDLAHLHFITLTVSIDYMRDADALWKVSRQTFTDSQTHYLYNPRQVAETSFTKVLADMQRYHLSKKPEKDAKIWYDICQTLTRYFKGNVYELLQTGEFDARLILGLVRNPRYRFPYLKGNKIAPLWLRMLADSWQGHPIHALQHLPIPVDRHIAAATVMTGCLRGIEGVDWETIKDNVTQVWFKACEGTEFYPLQFDEALWHLSRRGCRKTVGFPCQFQSRCPVSQYCTEVSLTI